MKVQATKWEKLLVIHITKGLHPEYHEDFLQSEANTGRADRKMVTVIWMALQERGYPSG